MTLASFAEVLEENTAALNQQGDASEGGATPEISFVITAGGIAAALGTSTQHEETGDECFSDGPQCNCWKTPGRTCSTCQ